MLTKNKEQKLRELRERLEEHIEDKRQVVINFDRDEQDPDEIVQEMNGLGYKALSLAISPFGGTLILFERVDKSIERVETENEKAGE